MYLFKNKSLNIQRDKMFLSAVAIFISIYIAFSCTYLAKASQSVREDVVRLHILANSDSKEDQDVKIKVRDALLKRNTAILSDSVNVDNAQVYFEESQDELLQTVKQVLRENGFNYNAQIVLEKEYYETRKYGELTFPAGEYMSLKVVLGKGEGHNWWCVMFPPLCVPAADDIKTDEEITEEYLTSSEERVVKGGERYIVRFKIIEFFEKLKSEG